VRMRCHGTVALRSRLSEYVATEPFFILTVQLIRRSSPISVGATTRTRSCEPRRPTTVREDGKWPHISRVSIRNTTPLEANESSTCPPRSGQRARSSRTATETLPPGRLNLGAVDLFPATAQTALRQNIDLRVDLDASPIVGERSIFCSVGTYFMNRHRRRVLADLLA
jgi:hypothetical protein